MNLIVRAAQATALLTVLVACGQPGEVEEKASNTSVGDSPEAASSELVPASPEPTPQEEVDAAPSEPEPEEASEPQQEESTEESDGEEDEAEEPTSDADSVPETQEYSGSGADVVLFDEELGQEPFTAMVHHDGLSNFAVWTVGADGSNLDLLVNTVGSYSGRSALNFMEDPVGLQIDADGPWTVTVEHLSGAPRWEKNSIHEGDGDDVIIVDGGVEGLTPARITNRGDSNFAVWAYGDDRDLLVNDIGSYEGRVILPSGTVVLVVTSDGTWTIETD